MGKVEGTNIKKQSEQSWGAFLKQINASKVIWINSYWELRNPELLKY